MKNILKHALIAAVAGVVLAGCETTNYGVDKGDDPVVEYVRPIAAAESDTFLVEASMGSTVVLMGRGLAGVKEVWFNEHQAGLNPTMITDRSVVVTVPGAMPQELTNLITVKTKKGKETTYPFVVKIPVPKITGVSNLLAPAGWDVTITGEYFFKDDAGKIKVVFPGGVEATVKSFTESSAVVTVPDGAVAGAISITSKYGTGRSDPAEVPYGDRTGIFVTGDPSDATWGTGDFGETDGYDGSYIKFEGELGSWSWPANNLQFLHFGTGQSLAPYITMENLAEYALRFEAWSHTWSDTQFIFRFGPYNSGNSVEDTMPGMFLWKPWINGDYNTGTWTTITVPLTDFNTTRAGDVTDKTIGDGSNMVEFYIMPFGAAAGPNQVKLWLDNLRIVKIK